MAETPDTRSIDSLRSSLSHTGALLRRKVEELSLIRELGDAATHIGNGEHLGAAVAHAVQDFLKVDACAVLTASDDGWSHLGGCALDPVATDPRHVAEGLLEEAGASVGGIAFSRTDQGVPPQLALEMKQGRRRVGALVLTDDDVGRLHHDHKELLAIVAAQVANLLAVTQLFARTADANRYLEAELERRSRLLRAAQETLHQKEKLASLGQLLTGVSHEVNNRLVPILGYAQLLKDLDLPPDAARAVASIENAALGSRQIVKDLLAFGRPEQPQLAPVRLTDVLREVAAGFAVEDPPVHVRVLVDGDPPPVLVDAHQVEQVFQNLIRNAAEAVEGRPDGTVRVTVQGAQARVTVSVEDNGRGMPDEIRRRVFEPFFTTKNVGKGTGLGLSLSYGLVQANGGEIEVESREGVGTRFWVSFPVPTGALRAEPAAGESAQASHDVHHDMPLNCSRILVIEDESEVSEFLLQALGPGCEVTVAGDTTAARRALKGGSFDVVLLDLRLDRDDGMRFFEWVRTAAPELAPHVVFMTGDAQNPEAGRFLATQPNPRLYKPFTIDELSETLRRAAA
jgi:signal transduction histidine kinase/CheY-like chemotaxis protein